MLFRDVTFRAGDGEHVALVGANGAGKSTLFAAIAGDVAGRGGKHPRRRRAAGHAPARRLARRGTHGARPAPVALGPRRCAGLRPRSRTPRRRTTADPSDRTGLALARAHAEWGDAGGWDAEVLWDTCTIARDAAAVRRGGRAAALDALGWRAEAARARGRCSAPLPTCCCSTSPTTTSMSRARMARRRRSGRARRRSCSISHDRALLARAADKVVTLEGRDRVDARCFVRDLARGSRRPARAHRRGTPPLAGGAEAPANSQLQEFRRRASMGSDKFASARARDEVEDRAVRGHRADRARPGAERSSMRLGGDRTGKRVVIVRAARAPRAHRSVRRRGAGSASASRCSGRTAPARATSSAPRGRAGRARRYLAARRARRPRLLLADPRPARSPRCRGARHRDEGRAVDRGRAMAALRRYGLHGRATQSVRHAVGRPAGPPADPAARADAARTCCCSTSRPTTSTSRRPRRWKRRSTSFVGTVIAVTHDRWFLRTFDRFFVFARDCTVTEHLEPVFA